MTTTLTGDQVRLLRARAQLLYLPSEEGSVARVMRHVCGLQAQDWSAATLGVRVRTAGLYVLDVERARLEERSAVRTWAMRGTLHLVAAEDLGWLLPVLAPAVLASGRRRRAELGFDDDTCARGVHVLENVLAHGPLTRGEVVDHLARHGLRLEGQAAYHLLLYAGLQGVVCYGPDREREPTYALLHDWARPGRAVPRDAGLEELVRRYLRAYGPATPQDAADWSGLPIGDVRAGWIAIASELAEVTVRGWPVWMLRERLAWLDEPPANSPVVRLLPSFDAYLLGYRGRDLSVPSKYANLVNAGGGLVRPTVAVDGRVVGTWRLQRRQGGGQIRAEPFGVLAPEIRTGLEDEAQDVGRFLGVAATLAVEE